MTNEKVAVLLGGTSAERDVSLNSGNAVLNALLEKGVNAHPIDPKTYPLMQLKEDGFTKAFISLHGRGGEDGTIQSILSYLKIPFTGSKTMASALTMDKWRTKLVWKALDLPTSEFLMLSKNNHSAENYHAFAKKIGFPLFVKPSNEGSSVGMSKVKSADELDSAIQKAFECDDEILLERFLAGSEFTVAIIGNEVLPSIRIEANADFYDYNAKYVSNETKYFCPSGLNDNEENEIRELALNAYKAVGCFGWARVDIMKDVQGKMYLLEVNTSPGMTNHSLVPMAAKQAGMSFSDLVIRILNSATF